MSTADGSATAPLEGHTWPEGWEPGGTIVPRASRRTLDAIEIHERWVMGIGDRAPRALSPRTLEVERRWREGGTAAAPWGTR